jgi:hypothetical protein
MRERMQRATLRCKRNLNREHAGTEETSHAGIQWEIIATSCRLFHVQMTDDLYRIAWTKWLEHFIFGTGAHFHRS